MINIISRAFLSGDISGPNKVVKNLISGLELIGYPYVVNQRLDACERLYIQDDRMALEQIQYLPDNIKSIVGPNLYVTPKDLPVGLELKNTVYIQPSTWTADFFRDFGFDKCPLDYWATGINTEQFKPANNKKDRVVVYFKQREQSELDLVLGILNKKGIDFDVIRYGSYAESQYLEALAHAKYLIWIGCKESQGIALEEALAMDVPMLVWDVTSLGQCSHGGEFNEEEFCYPNTTSAPYFSEQCGIIVNSSVEIREKIELMEATFREFQPRQYILDNLTLDLQAKKLLMLYEKHFGLEVESGFDGKQLQYGKWRNDRLFIKIYLQNKHMIKKVIRPIKKIFFNC